MNTEIKLIAAAAAIAGAATSYAMKPNDIIHNFTVKSVTELPEVPGRLWRMSYEKNGADLAWLERDDVNKTFAIGFKTVPEDDTGVAHIMEHSVLCGSRKYPVKEPFVDLLKSSLATFLNAMTYPDKTVYPVATRNDADFLNLIDVYMDAVLHPLSMENRMALDQEGWHYEFDEKGRLTMNGVVYSEMKGVFSNPDSVAFWETMQLLFPDCCYAHESGGDPAHIPELTFEAYKAFHSRFYHPSNARIFLDGKMDIDAVLARLDSYLREYARAEVRAEIPYQRPVANSATVKYEVAEGDKDKYILTDGWVIGRFDERERQLAFVVLSDVLAGSNEAPLKKALLDKGLCEDVELGAEGVQQVAAMLTIRNTTKEKAAECRKVVRETLERLAREGLDRKRLEAVLNRSEFLVREKDSGARPRGLAFMAAAYDMWMYGGDPADGFRYKADFDSLRAKVATGGFERYLREMLIDNPHHAELTLEPSTTLGEERSKALEERLEKLKSGWDEAKVAEVKATAAKLKEFQKSKDRPEDAAKLPMLAVKDIPVKGEELRQEVVTLGGRPVIRPKVGADGIFYLELYFSLADLTAEELAAVPFFTTLLGDLPTANFGTLELKSEIDANLGRFSVGEKTFDSKGVATPYVCVQIGALEAKCDDATRIAKEVLLGTKFEDVKAAADLLKQSRQDMEQSMASAGNQYAMRRAGSRLSRQNGMEEVLSGVAQLRWLQKAKADGALLARYAALARRVFTKGRLTVCLSDNMPKEFAAKVVEAWPDGEEPKAAEWNAGLPPAEGGEGFTIPAEVAYAGVAARLPEGVAFHGSQVVASRILTLDYLWNEIRVLGGAYGMGLVVRADGDVQYMTYRDPNPSRSLGKFDDAGAALKKFCEGDQPFDKYVVSAIGKSEPYLSPRLEVQRAAELFLSGRGPDFLAQLRKEILSTRREDLARFADVLTKVTKGADRCVVGGKKPLEKCKLSRTESVSD